MKRNFVILSVISCFMFLNACGNRQENVDNTSKSDAELSNTQNTQDDIKPDSEHSQTIPDEPVQNTNVKSNCDDIDINPEDAKSWTCLNGIWTCLNEQGCILDGKTHVMWSYLGDKAPGKIPNLPANPVGYKLIPIEVEINKDDYEKRLAWVCDEILCVCGGMLIRQYDRCIDESIGIYNKDIVCGTTTCKVADTCKDGQCLCGDTPETEEYIGHYECKFGAFVCKDAEGCTCQGNRCPIGAICDVNGCRCGELKIGELTDTAKYGCIENQLVCIDKDGCQCGDVICPEGAFCLNDTCTCGETPIGKQYDGRKYKCGDNHRAVCKDPQGCECGNAFTPKGGTCIDGRGYCGEVPIHTADLAFMNSGYVCNAVVPQPECANPNGCACGNYTCPQHTACNNGKCAYQNIRDLDARLFSDSHKYSYSGLMLHTTFEPFVEGGTEYQSYEIGYNLVCQDMSGCRCGGNLCLYGEQCTIDGCMCGTESDDSDAEDFERNLKEGYACLGNAVVCNYCKAEICNSNNYKSCAIVCSSEDGCKCDEKICPMNTQCISGDCYCAGELPQFNQEDIGDYQCNRPNGEDDKGNDNLIVGLVCQSESGCRCGETYCPLNARCTSDGCECDGESIPVFDEESVRHYECLWEPEDNDGDKYNDDHVDIITGLKCDSADGCKCGDTYCAKDSVCKSDGCYCAGLKMPVFDKADFGDYLCYRDDDGYDKHNGLMCKSESGCKCGNTYCPEHTICTSDGCTCDSISLPNINEKDIGNYKDIENYICYFDDATRSGLTCKSESGCECGDHFCIEGAVCTTAGCECGGMRIPDSEMYIPDDELNEAKYVCEDDKLLCVNDNGCKCGTDNCKKYDYCIDNHCVSADELEDKDDDSEDNEDKDDDSDDNDDEDECGGCGPIYDYVGGSESFSFSLGKKEGNTRYCPGECTSASGWEWSDVDVNDYCTRTPCTDCDSFTCEVSYFDRYQIPPKISGKWMCLKHGGCHHASMYYHYNMSIDEPGINYTGYPRIESEVEFASGEEVIVCNDILPYSVLKRDYVPGTLDNRDFVCDIESCVCGNIKCKLGEYCDHDAGKCSKYKACPYTETESVFYCHSAGKTPELKPKAIGRFGSSHSDYKCLEIANGGRHWYCSPDVLRDEFCVCGNTQCPKGAYCKDEQCLCGNDLLKEGYRCENNKQICDNPNCLCGDEPLREGYQCSLDNKQICNSEKCVCGENKVIYNDICSHDKVYCAEGRRYKANADCLCGDKLLSEKYTCVSGHVRCDPDTYGGCICHDQKISWGDFCLDENETISCRISYHKGCICGKLPLAAEYKCNDDKQICITNSCDCGKNKCSYEQFCEDGQCHCGFNSIKPGCMCGKSQLKEGYRCLSDLQLLVEDDERQDAYCPVVDPFNGITYQNGMCYCNGMPIPSEQIQKHEYYCKYGTAWLCVKESCKCGGEIIKKGSYCVVQKP